MATRFETEYEHWQAVVDRDHQAEGAFWLGVRSTGIFCRPGCPARTPLRRNVVFFDSLTDALRSGLRPCKRCRPLGAERVQHQLPLAESVIGAAGDAGYGSNAQFYADAPATLGMSPGKFRSKGEGEAIRYAVVDTWLGQILIAATERGICRIRFGEDARTLEADLMQDFANANILAPDHDFAALVQSTIDAIGTESAATLPLDIRGTAFQARVWNTLRRIPFGRTVSYGDLAREIGQPTASRAVASACGRNDIAVLIPCHRVIGKNGSLTGYRWGVERKRALLEKERSSSP